MLEYFNKNQTRQFYSNSDYERFGGRAMESDDEGDSNEQERSTSNKKNNSRRGKRTAIANSLED